METKYSVLMSVYFKEKAEFLQQSIQSIMDQTILPDQFVLVCDGELTEPLNDVIQKFLDDYSDIMEVVRLETNQGLGRALNEGLKHCRNELVARMDSDDISRPNRCEKQLEVFNQHPEYGIVSGTIEEFSECTGSIPEVINVRKVLPETHDEIKKYMKRRNPFNHPCVMYRCSEVIDAGSYQDFYLLEDYYLWIRMIINGSIGYNIQEPLLWMRAGSEMYRRRSGWRYVKSQCRLFKYMYDQGVISWFHYRRCCIERAVGSLVPNKIRQAAYSKFLRK